MSIYSSEEKPKVRKFMYVNEVMEHAIIKHQTNLSNGIRTVTTIVKLHNGMEFTAFTTNADDNRFSHTTACETNLHVIKNQIALCMEYSTRENDKTVSYYTNKSIESNKKISELNNSIKKLENEIKDKEAIIERFSKETCTDFEKTVKEKDTEIKELNSKLKFKNIEIDTIQKTSSVDGTCNYAHVNFDKKNIDINKIDINKLIEAILGI